MFNARLKKLIQKNGDSTTTYEFDNSVPPMENGIIPAQSSSTGPYGGPSSSAGRYTQPFQGLEHEPKTAGNWVNMEPKGVDTVPAMLAPGENVMNAEVSRLPGMQSLFDNLNGIGRAMQEAQGGPIPTYDNMPSSEPVYAFDGQLINFLKGAEDFRGEAYKDGNGWSIGYGSSGAKEGDTITEEEALNRLKRDLGWVNKSYDSSVTNRDLNRNQANAVKSLIYNIGAPNWEKSKARTALNAGDLEGFEREMREFRMSGDQVLPGLEKRRNDEMALFNTSAVADVPVPMGKPEMNNQMLAANEWGNQVPEFPQAGNFASKNLPANKYGFSGYTGIPSMGNIPPSINPTISTGGPTSSHAKKYNHLPPFNYTAETDDVGEEIDKPGWLDWFKNFRIGGAPYDFNALHDEEKAEVLKEQIQEAENMNKNSIADEETHLNLTQETIKEALNSELAKGSPSITKTLTEKYDNNLKRLEEISKKKKEKSLSERFGDASKDIFDELDSAQKRADEIKYGGNERGVPDQIKDIPPNVIDEDKKFLDDLISQYDNVTDFEGDAPPPEDLEEKGNSLGNAITGGIIDSFKSAFSNLFDEEELARMAIMYAGSRAFGYGHGDSITWAAKNYIKRVDSKIATAREDEKDEIKERKKFTRTQYAIENLDQNTFNEFIRTGDPSVLKDKVTGNSIKKPVGSYWLDTVGEVQAFEMANKVVYLDIGGEMVDINNPKLRGKIHTWKDKNYNYATINDSFIKGLDEAQKYANLTLKDEDKLDQELVSVAGEMTDDYLSDITRLGGGPDAYRKMRSLYSNAARDYIDAWKDYKKDPKAFNNREPASVKQFVTQRMITYKTQLGKKQGIPYKAFKETSNYNFEKLNEYFENYADDETDYAKDWQLAWADWNSAKKKGAWDKAPPAGHTKFTFWLQALMFQGDPNAAKLVGIKGDKKDKIIENYLEKLKKN